MSFASSFDSTPGKPGGFNGFDAFDATEAAAKLVPVPPGLYAVRVVSGRLDKTRKGDDCYKLTFEVTEGDHRGRRLFRVWTFTEKAIPYAKRDLAAFGLASTQDLLSPYPPAGAEIHLRVIAAVQRMDDGTEVNDVKGFADIQRKAAPAPPPAGASPFGQFGLDKPGSEGGTNGTPF